MTFIFCLGNQQQVIIVSDRRLSSDGRLVTDESNKAAILNCKDARLAVAFTGLARTGTFETKRWLLEALLDSANPDYLMASTIDRFRQRATEDFQKIVKGQKKDKRLSVVLAGYWYGEAPPRCHYFLVSNFEALGEEHPSNAQSSDDFSIYWGRESRSGEKRPSFLITAGYDKGVIPKHIEPLRTLLRENRPAEGIVFKAVETLHLIADSPLSKNTIGKQCTSIILPRDPDAEALVQYHSGKVSRKIYGVSIINARGGEHGAYLIDSPEVQNLDASGHPLILEVPRVRRNQPCPCGSGKKYKICHGQAGTKGQTLKFGS